MNKYILRMYKKDCHIVDIFPIESDKSRDELKHEVDIAIRLETKFFDIELEQYNHIIVLPLETWFNISSKYKECYSANLLIIKN